MLTAQEAKKKEYRVRSRPKFHVARRILENLEPPDEFAVITAYGPLGRGKSCYVTKVFVETLVYYYEVTFAEAWDLAKQYIIFHPEQFFEKLDEIETLGLGQIPGLIWDDAGLWLYALQYNDPFILSVGKYLNVARTHLAALLATTPTPTWIFRKLRDFPDAITCSITKKTAAPRTEWLRRARLYKQYYNIVKGIRVQTLHRRGPSGEKIPLVDDFSCRFPDRFFTWYKPLRDAYEDMALQIMREEFAKVKLSSKAADIESYGLPVSLPSIEKLSLRHRKT